MDFFSLRSFYLRLFVRFSHTLSLSLSLGFCSCFLFILLDELVNLNTFESMWIYFWNFKIDFITENVGWWPIDVIAGCFVIASSLLYSQFEPSENIRLRNKWFNLLFGSMYFVFVSFFRALSFLLSLKFISDGKWIHRFK